MSILLRVKLNTNFDSSSLYNAIRQLHMGENMQLARAMPKEKLKLNGYLQEIDNITTVSIHSTISDLRVYRSGYDPQYDFARKLSQHIKNSGYYV